MQFAWPQEGSFSPSPQALIPGGEKEATKASQLTSLSLKSCRGFCLLVWAPLPVKWEGRTCSFSTWMHWYPEHAQRPGAKESGCREAVTVGKEDWGFFRIALVELHFVEDLIVLQGSTHFTIEIQLCSKWGL